MKLVFLHGAGCSSLSFYYQLRHFRSAKAIDLPGHPDGKPCETIDGYLEWVRGFMKARRYKNVILCGHSMGGAIAMRYAHKYPEELRGLVLLGTAPAFAFTLIISSAAKSRVKTTFRGSRSILSTTGASSRKSSLCCGNERRRLARRWS